MDESEFPQAETALGGVVKVQIRAGWWDVLARQRVGG
jgi:hypothetical protein